jgi:hypothetical protein
MDCFILESKAAGSTNPAHKFKSTEVGLLLAVQSLLLHLGCEEITAVFNGLK